QQRWRVVPWPVGVPLPPGAEVVGQWPPPGQAPADEGSAQWLADGDAEDPQRRNDKALAYFQLFQPYLGYGEDEIEGDPDSGLEAFSRAGGLRLPVGGASTRRKPFPDSPVYYIRMPAAPYVFVPGLGYVSQPPPPPPPPPRRAATYNPFINVPVEFVSNGKPTGVYRWQGRPASTTTTPKPALQQSAVNTLDKGPYVFNGKPSRVHVLRDQYNVLYADALQNFYP
ncbi:uncharacterized protein LOC126456528, partial [Schistocerca serialis cubense]